MPDHEHEQCRCIIRSIVDAVVATDLRRVITYMNPAAEILTGWSSTEAIGKSFGDVFILIDDARQQPIDDPIARVVGDGRILPLTALTVVRRDGVRAPAAGSGAPLWLEDGGIGGAVFVVRDVSRETRLRDDHARLPGEADRLRQEVARSSDARDELFAMLGHELRNPLAPIVSTLELVRRRVGDSIGRELAIIERNVEHVVRLVDEFLELPAVARTPPNGPRRLQRESAVAARRARRVLVVDDNVDAAEMLAETLSDLGIDSHAAFDADSALIVARELKPTVAILDIGLPDIDGYELARRLREQEGSSDMLLIALTGFGQSADRARARAAGFDAHCVKPIAADTLVALIATLEDNRAVPN